MTIYFPIVGKYQHCEHGFDHPPWAHSCDGCFCDDERDKARGWDKNVGWKPEEL